MSNIFDPTALHALQDEAKQSSALWADVILRQAEAGTQEFVIIDCESTGMDAAAEPVQLTVLNWDGSALLNTLVKPGVKIQPRAYQIHKLAWADVKDAPTFPQVMEDFRRVVSGKLVIAYNLNFDRRIIRQTAEKYRIRPPGAAAYDCAMLRYAAFYGEPKASSGDWEWQSLNNACAQMGITRDSAHAALADCQATLQLIQAMALAKNA